MVFDPMVHEQDRLTICRLPKHSGKLWVDVVDEDRQYVEWLVSGDCGVTLNSDVYDYLIELLEEL